MLGKEIEIVSRNEKRGRCDLGEPISSYSRELTERYKRQLVGTLHVPQESADSMREQILASIEIAKIDPEKDPFSIIDNLKNITRNISVVAKQTRAREMQRVPIHSSEIVVYSRR